MQAQTANIRGVKAAVASSAETRSERIHKQGLMMTAAYRRGVEIAEEAALQGKSEETVAEEIEAYVLVAGCLNELTLEGEGRLLKVVRSGFTERTASLCSRTA